MVISCSLDRAQIAGNTFEHPAYLNSGENDMEAYIY